MSASSEPLRNIEFSGGIQTQVGLPRLDIREYALVCQTRCPTPQASDLAGVMTSQRYKHRLDSVYVRPITPRQLLIGSMIYHLTPRRAAQRF